MTSPSGPTGPQDPFAPQDPSAARNPYTAEGPQPYPPYPNPYGGPAPYGVHPGPALPRDAYASWGRRVGSVLLDWLIVGLVPAIVGGIGYVILLRSMFHRMQTCIDMSAPACRVTPADYPPTAMLLLGIASLLGLAATLWLCWREGTTGLTPGRRIAGARLVSASTGQPIGFGMAFVRRLLQVVDALPCYLGLLWPIWDDRKQTFSDKMLGTVVLRHTQP